MAIEAKTMASFGIALLWISLSICAVMAGEIEAPKGSISVKVTFEGDGKPAPGAGVVVEGKKYRAGDAGDLRVGGIEVGDRVVSVEKIVRTGGFLGLFKREERHLGFGQVLVEPGKTSEIEVKLRVEEEIDPVCRSCHPGQKSRDNPIVKCLHRSGEILPEIMVGRVKRYNETVELLEIEGKPHSLPMKLEKKVVDEKVVWIYTCESCHTFHLVTPYRRYAIAPFFKGSDLCKACHG